MRLLAGADLADGKLEAEADPAAKHLVELLAVHLHPATLEEHEPLAAHYSSSCTETMLAP